MIYLPYINVQPVFFLKTSWYIYLSIVAWYRLFCTQYTNYTIMYELRYHIVYAMNVICVLSFILLQCLWVDIWLKFHTRLINIPIIFYHQSIIAFQSNPKFRHVRFFSTKSHVEYEWVFFFTNNVVTIIYRFKPFL